jgi:hypothetical protein
MSERSRPRLELAVEWIAWHAAELAGVTVPLILAVCVTWWFGALSAAVGAGWAVYEWRDHRTQARLRAAAEARALVRAPVDEDQVDSDASPTTVPFPGQDDENRSAR